MHVSKRKIVGPILIVLLLALFILVWQAGNFLVLNQAPQKADVIIILGGCLLYTSEILRNIGLEKIEQEK